MKAKEITCETDLATTRQALGWFVDNGVPSQNIKRTVSRVSKVQHLRIQMPEEQIRSILQRAGAQVTDQNVPDLSGKYTDLAVVFPDTLEDKDLAGQTVYFVSTFKQQSSGGQAKIAQKQLIPTKLGLEGKTFTKSTLVSTLKKAIPGLNVDDVLKEFLIQLVEVAAGERKKADAEVNSQIDADTRRIVGIDFGEILTPIVMADPSEEIIFPTGNAMLADVEINGRPISVKSGAGSGTSFRAIRNVMDKFKEQIKKGSLSLSDQEKEAHRFFRAFVDTEGNNKDKIIAGSQAANTEENQAMAKVIGKKDFTFNDLKEFAGQFDEYGDFLKAVYPISVAGDRKRPSGMPADYKYYMKLSDAPPNKKKQAGKASWDARGATAGADIMVYILGTGFLADAKTVAKRDDYNNLLKKMMGKVEAMLAHITVTKDGRIEVKKKPFSQMNYEFQYHAPSHIPGNNLPGFTLVID